MSVFPSRAGAPPGQYSRLTRHFFGGFFDNELVSPGGDMQLSVTYILAVLASPGMIYPLLALVKYSGITRLPDAVRDPLSWSDKLFYISFAFAVMGFVTVLEWDSLFPDLRDWLILRPLPVSLRTAFFAKVSALALFLVVFSVDINAVGTLLYPAVANTNLFWWGIAIQAHAAAVFSASAFVFLFILTLEGALMNVLSYRLFRRVSPYVQLIAMVWLLSMFLLYPSVASSLETMKREGSPALYCYPPAWFLGLYEVTMGFGDGAFNQLARFATGGLGVAALAAAITYAASYNRHARRCLESERQPSTGRAALAAAAASLLNRTVLRRPAERGAFYFVGKTIYRSRRHWLLLAAYAGAGFALVIEALVAALGRSGYAAVSRPSAPMLSLQLMLSFFVLSGMRFIFTLPAELSANWVFRVTDSGRGADCLAGVRKAILIFAIAPVFGGLLPFHWVLWGWQTAVLHLGFGVAMAMLLMEALLLRFRKIPFTCTYLPGKTKLFASWVAYWALFSTYAYTMASLEQWLLRDTGRMAVFLAGCAVLLWGLEFLRKRLVADELMLVFEDRPEPLLQTLDLDVGL